MKIKDLIINGTNILKNNKIEDSNIIANLLAQKLLKMDKVQIVVNLDKDLDYIKQKEYNTMIIKYCKVRHFNI